MLVWLLVQHQPLIRTIHPAPIIPRAIRRAVHPAHRKVLKHRPVLVQPNEANARAPKLKPEVRILFHLLLDLQQHIDILQICSSIELISLLIL